MKVCIFIDDSEPSKTVVQQLDEYLPNNVEEVEFVNVLKPSLEQYNNTLIQNSIDDAYIKSEKFMTKMIDSIELEDSINVDYTILEPVSGDILNTIHEYVTENDFTKIIVGHDYEQKQQYDASYSFAKKVINLLDTPITIIPDK